MNLSVILCACYHIGNPPLIESPDLTVGAYAGLALFTCIFWDAFIKKDWRG